VSDDMLDTFVPSGNYDKIADVLHRAFDGVASHVTLPMPADPTRDEAHAVAVAALRA
jgi:hypothetical protein